MSTKINIRMQTDRSEDYAAAAKQKKRIPFNVAVADFLHAPDIEAIDLSAYHGQEGDAIRIEVTDDFAVREVRVVISDAESDVIEEGHATQSTVKYEWTYKTTVSRDSLSGERIEVYASDLPGNVSRAEVVG